MGTLGDGKRKQPNEAQWGPPGGSEEAIVKRAEALHSRRSSFKTGDIPHVTSATFYLDAEIMDVDDVIDPYAMPDSNTANRLFQFYLEKVHRSFPILPRATVQNMRRHLDYLQERRIFSYDAKLQANMNLVFAIAAVYARLTQTELEGDNCEHLMYMMRGVRVLDIKDLAGISTANMSLIQVRLHAACPIPANVLLICSRLPDCFRCIISPSAMSAGTWSSYPLSSSYLC